MLSSEYKLVLVLEALWLPRRLIAVDEVDFFFPVVDGETFRDGSLLKFSKLFRFCVGKRFTGNKVLSPANIVIQRRAPPTVGPVHHVDRPRGQVIQIDNIGELSKVEKSSK